MADAMESTSSEPMEQEPPSFTVEGEGAPSVPVSTRKHSVFTDLGDLFEGLKLANRDENAAEEIIPVVDQETMSDATHFVEDLNLSVASKRFCGSCGIEFDDRNEQVVHFGSDWHRFNLKRKIAKGLSPVTREKFEEMADDLSSISGSDSTPDSDSDDADRSLDNSYDSEMTSHRLPRLYFRNGDGHLLSMYRCVLVDKKNYEADVTTLAPRVGESGYWAVFMLGGGHFAGAVFDKTELVVHKTFHRYTVRAKRGTAQGMHDQKGSFAKSAGSSLRRYNEAQLVQDVQDLLQSWSGQLDLCSRVFLRAPSYNKAIFFAHKQPPFDRADPRIRMIPFPTRRPTMKEVKRVHNVLSTVTNHGTNLPIRDTRSPNRKLPRNKHKDKVKVPAKCQGHPLRKTESESESDGEIEFVMVDEELSTTHLKDFEITRKPRRRKKKPKPEAETKAEAEEISTEVPIEPINLTDEEKKLRDDVYTACKTGNVESLRNIVAGYHGNEQTSADFKTEDFDDLPVVEERVLFGEKENGCHGNAPAGSRLPDGISALRFGVKNESMLHVTSRAELPEMTYYLLEMGVDPTIKDSVGLVPYAVCKSRAVRNEYRRFMAAYPDRYDYTAAQVPAPLTEDMENERKMKELERKKLAKKAKRERQKDQKERDALLAAENREKERYLKLSDREKRALAAERRLLDQVVISGGQIPVLSRCWQCGEDISGKTPFEYYDYKFCTTKCLKLHRTQSNQSNAPR